LRWISLILGWSAWEACIDRTCLMFSGSKTAGWRREDDDRQPVVRDDVVDTGGSRDPVPERLDDDDGLEGGSSRAPVRWPPLSPIVYMVIRRRRGIEDVCDVLILRGVVDSARGPRSASQDAPHRERDASNDPEIADGLLGVRRTGGMKAAAAAAKVPERNPVQADQPKQRQSDRSPHCPEWPSPPHVVTPTAAKAPSISAWTSGVLAP
jgi:hypothetical protein